MTVPRSAARTHSRPSPYLCRRADPFPAPHKIPLAFFATNGVMRCTARRSHRETDGPYQRMQQRVAQQVRAALDVPRGYEILFMQGGAHAQFAAVPLNLLGTPQGPERQASASVDTGFWARRAAKEHAKYARVTWAAKAEQFSSVPHEQQWQLTGNESYVHICANETIEGLEYLRDPDLSHLGYRAPPIAADFTSTLLSRPVDISKYGVVYCSGGNNLGPAGLTLVIVREDLLTDHLEHPFCPAILSYRSLARSQPIPNIYATPPTFNVYMLGLVLEHLQAKGGVSQASVDAEWRAALVYNTIEASKGFYTNKVVAESRSRMSVPFRISGGRAPADALALEQTFLKQMEAAGFRHLAGHPLHGGVRASLYHGVPNDSVLALVAFMERFQKRHQ